MIDTHCHLLPGLDDGALHMEESIAMAKDAVNQGITAVIATPHHRTTRYDNPRAKVIAAVEQLNKRLGEEQIPLTVYPGQEIRIHGEMSQAFDTDELLSLNETGRYVLIELPTDHVPAYAEHLFYNLETQGYTPVIAHPERNLAFLADPNKFFDLVRNGALAQLTVGSLRGDSGKKVKQFSINCLTHHLVHILASDAHHAKKRQFDLKEGYQLLRKTIGYEEERRFKTNAEALLKGEALDLNEPVRIARKKRLGLF